MPFLHHVRPSWIVSALVVVVATLAGPVAGNAAVVIDDYGPIADEDSVPGFRGAGLEVEIRRGSHWGLGTFRAVPGRPDEAWFRYMIALDEWAPSQSGKLPGFASLRGSSARGCVPATDAAPGWSARMMYRASGTAGAPEGASRLGYYVYHLDQPTDCGEIMEWADPGVVAPGGWHCIEGHIRLNDVGERNGVLQGWVDGKVAFQRDGLRFRDRPDIGVDDLWLNVYSGGKAASPEQLSLRLDEVAISTSSRIGCPDAFDDDEVDPNEAAINRLAGLGAFPECGPLRACPSEPVTRSELVDILEQVAGSPPSLADVEPDEPITRGDAAVLISEAFSLPAVGGGRFADVDDPAQRRAAHALAGARLSGGCAPERFCPADPLTRSQAASIIAGAITQERVAPPANGRSQRPDLEEVRARQQRVAEN